MELLCVQQTIYVENMYQIHQIQSVIGVATNSSITLYMDKKKCSVTQLISFVNKRSEQQSKKNNINI